MHAFVRQYTRVTELMDQMEARHHEIEELMGGVPGFISYYGIRNGDALKTVTVCEDEAGTSASSGVAAGWVAENLPDLTANAPSISSGEVFFTHSV